MSYNKKIWKNGDIITKEGMNNIEDGIYNAHEEINTLKNNTSTGGGGSGEVDLSGYVTKETGNANQITFADGQTFQAKLDAGTLKGEKGDAGEQGIQGEKGDKGDKGQDGLTTAISVNGTTYTHSNGTITLPNYPTVPNTLPANGGNADTVDGFNIWSGTQAEYDAITSKSANTIYIIKEG